MRVHVKKGSNAYHILLPPTKIVLTLAFIYICVTSSAQIRECVYGFISFLLCVKPSLLIKGKHFFIVMMIQLLALFACYIKPNVHSWIFICIHWTQFSSFSVIMMLRNEDNLQQHFHLFVVVLCCDKQIAIIF